MRAFKMIDMWISILLIIGFATNCLVKMDIEDLLIGYFVVGGWQVISMLVHVFTGTFTYVWGARSVYHWITLICLLTMPIGSIWLLLFTAPFMAIYYTWLCYQEVYVKMQRPLADLK